jgi:MarR family transcriptional regulator, transcriptional regulator for hemolysin
VTTERVTKLLSLASRALTRAGDAALASTGLRMAHVPVVVLLRGSADGMTQKALAEAVGVEQPSMAQLLARMERDGLICRDPHPTDARSRLNTLADGQQTRITQAQRVLADLEQHAVNGLTADEVNTLRRLLGRVVTNLQTAGST